MLILGDVINIHDKQEDGWWLGELNGIIGIDGLFQISKLPLNYLNAKE